MLENQKEWSFTITFNVDKAKAQGYTQESLYRALEKYAEQYSAERINVEEVEHMDWYIKLGFNEEKAQADGYSLEELSWHVDELVAPTHCKRVAPFVWQAEGIGDPMNEACDAEEEISKDRFIMRYIDTFISHEEDGAEYDTFDYLKRRHPERLVG